MRKAAGTPTITPYTRTRIEDTPTARTSSTSNTEGYCFHKDAEGRYRFEG